MDGGARRIEIAGQSALELGPAGGPVELVFLHATGFHAGVYEDLLAPLAKSRRILAPDFRGHGRTPLHGDEGVLANWDPFIEDVLALIAAVGRPVVLAGHSLGGAVALLAAAEAGAGSVRSLMLVEPVMRPVKETEAEERRSKPIAQAAANRRRVFVSREAAFEGYRGRGPFRTWPDAAVRAYVEGGLVEAPEGVVLRCDPAWEAGIYMAFGSDVWAAAECANMPLVVRAGDQMSTFPPESERRLKALKPEADIRRIEGASHFLPLERPEVVREAIERAFALAV